MFVKGLGLEDPWARLLYSKFASRFSCYCCPLCLALASPELSGEPEGSARLSPLPCSAPSFLHAALQVSLVCTLSSCQSSVLLLFRSPATPRPCLVTVRWDLVYTSTVTLTAVRLCSRVPDINPHWDNHHRCTQDSCPLYQGQQGLCFITTQRVRTSISYGKRDCWNGHLEDRAPASWTAKSQAPLSTAPPSLHCVPAHCPRSGHCSQGRRPKGAERCGGHLDRIRG